MVKLLIDGREVTTEKGRHVLDVAREMGIVIPTLCHHESLPSYGACRLCIVEVTYRGKTKLQASCTLPVREGMKINTQSERVLKTRRLIMELLLARSPKSPVLKKLAHEIGVDQARFDHITGEDTPLLLGESPSTIVGDAGCIMCGMCVRICDDVMNIGALSFEGRGAKRHVTTPFRHMSEFCISCGACSSICPTGAIELLRIRPHEPDRIPNEFEYGMSWRKPVNISFPQAVPRVPVIDMNTCVNFKTGGCKVCEDNCQVEAIDHSQKDTVEEVQVGAIVVATGFELFDGKELPRYGYGRFDNVMSSLEFERLCHASGPTSGHIVTKEGKTPESVAILHCIGSRDSDHLEYCSRVCCMYSLKFAHLVKDHTGAEVYNFYIDIRAFGKGYEEFYKRLLQEGVHFIRGKAAEVTDVALTPEEEGKLIVVAEDTLLGMTRRVPADLVILSTGLKPAKGADEVGRIFSLGCGQGDFFLERHPKLAPVDTAADGIFLAGACQGPKDIPDSVAQGAAAAAGALSLIDKGKVVLEPITSVIDEELCAGCKLCISNCPYEAIFFDEDKKVSVVTEELCKGCGTCVAGCPSGAAKQEGFEDVQIFAEIDGALLLG